MYKTEFMIKLIRWAERYHIPEQAMMALEELLEEAAGETEERTKYDADL